VNVFKFEGRQIEAQAGCTITFANVFAPGGDDAIELGVVDGTVTFLL
jgi:hypothetical protein